MTPMMPPQMPPPAQKKGMSGCMIAFIVVSIVGFVTAVVVGVAIYLVATSNAGKTAIKLVGEGSKLAQKGLNAPGTAELRTLGCEQAVVLDMKDVGDMMNDVFDAAWASTPAWEGSSCRAPCPLAAASRSLATTSRGRT